MESDCNKVNMVARNSNGKTFQLKLFFNFALMLLISIVKSCFTANKITIFR